MLRAESSRDCSILILQPGVRERELLICLKLSLVKRSSKAGCGIEVLQSYVRSPLGFAWADAQLLQRC